MCAIVARTVRETSAFLHASCALHTLSRPVTEILDETRRSGTRDEVPHPTPADTPAHDVQGSVLNVLWEAMGVVQHHDAVAGTATRAVFVDYNERLAFARGQVLEHVLQPILNNNSTVPRMAATTSTDAGTRSGAGGGGGNARVERRHAADAVATGASPSSTRAHATTAAALLRPCEPGWAPKACAVASTIHPRTTRTQDTTPTSATPTFAMPTFATPTSAGFTVVVTNPVAWERDERVEVVVPAGEYVVRTDAGQPVVSQTYATSGTPTVNSTVDPTIVTNTSESKVVLLWMASKIGPLASVVFTVAPATPASDRTRA